MKLKPTNNKYDESVPVSPDNPRPMTREELFHFEQQRPHLKGIGRVMIELGLWIIEEPLSPVNMTYPDPMSEEMDYPIKIRRSVLNELIQEDPIFGDLEDQKVARGLWVIIEDVDDAPDSDR